MPGVDPDPDPRSVLYSEGWSSSGAGPRTEVQVQPVASEVLPMGNTALTSIAVERAAAARALCSGASGHREKLLLRYDVCLWKFLEYTGYILYSNKSAAKEFQIYDALSYVNGKVTTNICWWLVMLFELIH